jgi:hypothetical protein
MKETTKRIEDRKKVIGNRKRRKMIKYSENFTNMFLFFLQSYRKGLLTFCGSNVEVYQDLSLDDGKFCFRKFENGDYKMKDIFSKHPNILKGAVTGKKAWGLWCEQWTEGISDWTFTKDEIFEQFKDVGIEVPKVLEIEFDKLLEKKRWIRNDKYLESLKK